MRAASQAPAGCYATVPNLTSRELKVKETRSIDTVSSYSSPLHSDPCSLSLSASLMFIHLRSVACLQPTGVFDPYYVCCVCYEMKMMPMSKSKGPAGGGFMSTYLFTLSFVLGFICFTVVDFT
nr:hypothetical protein CFP56_56084 [Quercus suber]